MTKLSEHFTLEEFLNSATAVAKHIDNTPDADQLLDLTVLVEEVLEPLRLLYGNPIKINSGFRSKALNAAVKGSSTSQHCKGQAADIVPIPNIKDNLRKLFALIVESDLVFDQLIWENTWIHISRARKGNRRQILKYIPATGTSHSRYDDISKNWKIRIGYRG